MEGSIPPWRLRPSRVGCGPVSGGAVLRDASELAAGFSAQSPQGSVPVALAGLDDLWECLSGDGRVAVWGLLTACCVWFLPPPPPCRNSTGTASPDSIVKLKLHSSPYQSLRRTLLWGEKAGANLGLNMAAGNARPALGYTLYESHVGEPFPLERICRGPDGRFVVQSEARPRERLAAMLDRYSFASSGSSSAGQPEPYLQVYTPPRPEEPVWQRSIPLRPKSVSRARRDAKTAGRCQGRYFDCSSSSPAEEARPFCIVNISPVAAVPCQAVEQQTWAAPGPGGKLERAAASPPLSSSSSSSSSSRLGTPSLPTCRKSRNSQVGLSPSAQSGLLQYLSLPFFKEMNVDGDWPPEEEEGEEGKERLALQDFHQDPGPGGADLTLLRDEEKTPCPAYMDMQALPDSAQEQASATSLLRLPDTNMGPAKAALPGTSVGSSYLSPALAPPPEHAPWSQPPAQPRQDASRAELVYAAIPSERDWLQAAKLPSESVPAERPKLPSVGPLQGPPAEKPLRGSLTSQSSGRGSVSFLRPPSLAPSLGGSYLSSPFGDVASWHSGSTGEECKPKRDPSGDAVSKR